MDLSQRDQHGTLPGTGNSLPETGAKNQTRPVSETEIGEIRTHEARQTRAFGVYLQKCGK